MKGKNLLLGILVAMLVSAGLRMSGVSFFGGRTDPRSAEFLSEVAAEINKSTPAEVDADTELTEAEGLEGVLVYHYRLINLPASQVDATELYESMRPSVTAAACATREVRDKFLDQGIVLRYTYSDRDFRLLTEIDVTAADCEG